LLTGLTTGEPEIAVRDGRLYAARLARPADVLALPDDATPWHLVPSSTRLETAAWPEAAAPLTAGQVRVAVRAAALDGALAGIVVEAADAPFAVGDRVAGVVLD